MLGPSLGVQGGVSAVERLILESQLPDVSIRLLPTTFQVNNLWKAVLFVPAFWRLAGVLLTQRVDLVHIHFSIRGSMWRKAFCAGLAKRFRKPVLMHAHAGGFHEYLESLPRWQRRWFVRVLQRSDGLIALSEAWSRFYIDEVGVDKDRVYVLPNPVALPNEVPDRSNRSVTTIVFLGRMDENKGPVRILEAVARFSDIMKAKIRIHMAGDGEVDNVRRAAARLGLEKQTEIEDWVTPERRDEILARGDLFVLPSRAEGMPMSLLEALAWGLPVVTTPVGGIPAVVQNGREGFLVEPDDIESLSAAIATLVEDESLRLQMGAQARESAKRFDRSVYGKRLAEIYRDTIARIRSPLRE
jgi:glycosyltransferase involved in cell wall biosynthesis